MTVIKKERKPHFIALLIWAVSSFLTTVLVGFVMLGTEIISQQNSYSFGGGISTRGIFEIFFRVLFVLACLNLIPALALFSRIFYLYKKEKSNTEKQKATVLFSALLVAVIGIAYFYVVLAPYLDHREYPLYQIKSILQITGCFMSYAISFVSTTYFFIKNYYKSSSFAIPPSSPLDYFGDE